MKILSNNLLNIKINSFGAELSSIIKKDTGEEYLWQADPLFWKRHSPVLFPIVGSLWNNQYINEGKSYRMSQHGFARDMVFRETECDDNEAFYLLENNDETQAEYPYKFQLKIGYRLSGNKVTVIWEVKNTGQDILHFQIGAHPAFLFPSFDSSEELKGYFLFDNEGPLNYILIEEKGCVSLESYNLKTDNGLFPVTKHTFEKDALIFENSQLTQVTLLSKFKQPHLSLSFDAPVTGLWSPPGKDAPFVCIEPWYGRCDKVGYTGEFKCKDYMNHLNAGDVFSTSYTIEVF